jgi:hypothetical protein
VLAAIDPSWLFFAGVVILTTVLIRITYRRQGAIRRGLPASTAPSVTDPRYSPSHRDLLGRLESKEVEFQEVAREAIARLDNKIAILQRLLAEADAKIARLEQATLDRH